MQQQIENKTLSVIDIEVVFARQEAEFQKHLLASCEEPLYNWTVEHKKDKPIRAAIKAIEDKLTRFDAYLRHFDDKCDVFPDYLQDHSGELEELLRASRDVYLGKYEF
jgi:hypothetical protein